MIRGFSHRERYFSKLLIGSVILKKKLNIRGHCSSPFHPASFLFSLVQCQFLTVTASASPFAPFLTAASHLPRLPPHPCLPARRPCSSRSASSSPPPHPHPCSSMALVARRCRRRSQRLWRAVSPRC